MQSGRYSKVVEWVQEHSDTHQVFIMLPPQVIDEFQAAFPEVNQNWMPAIALENEDYDRLTDHLERYTYPREHQNIELSQMLQNFNTIQDRIMELFTQKGHEKVSRSGMLLMHHWQIITIINSNMSTTTYVDNSSLVLLLVMAGFGK